MSRELTFALPAGLASALMLHALAAGLPAGVLTAYLAPLPLFLVGLSAGWRICAVAGAFGAGLSLALETPMGAAAYVALYAAPAVLMCRLALVSQSDANAADKVWMPTGVLVAVLASVALAAMMAVFAIAPRGDEGIEGAVRVLVSQVVDLLAQNASREDKARAIALQVRFFPAGLAVAWMIMVSVNALAAQGLLARLGKAARPTPVLADLAVPAFALLPLVAGALLAFVDAGAYIGRNVAVVAAAPFFMQGLGVVHALARRSSRRFAVLAVFYGLFLVTSVWAAVAVAVLGLVDHLARRRLGASQA